MENFILWAVSVTAAKLRWFWMFELVVSKLWVSFHKDYTVSEFIMFFWSLFSALRTAYGDFKEKLCIKSKYGKLRTMKNYEFEPFHAVLLSRVLEYLPTGSHFILTFRSTGYGWASVCARVGGILAPQIKTLLDISVHLPFTLTGVLTAITCILCFFFKDTYSIVLDDHIRLDELNM